MFKKDKFSIILKNITNQYSSITVFSITSGVGRSYISKYIHQKMPTTPSSKVLKKIASASKGITNYDELMGVCGYISVTRTTIEDEAIKGLERMIKEQVMGYSLIDITLKYIKKLEGR